MTKTGRILLIILAAAGACRPAQAQEFRVKPDHTVVFGGQHLLPDYLPEFTVLFSAADPQLRMRPAGIPDVQYNVATWLSDRPELNRTDRRADQSGDGFDDEILEGSVESRTADLFNAGRIIVVRPVSHRAEGTDKVTFGYPENDLFSIAAELTADTATGRPLLTYRLTAKTGGWYSVGFTGFAGRDPKRTDEIWQPLIWQEKRFPDKSYLTLAFRCPVPSAFVTYRNATYGILAHPAEFPFDPLPTAANSRFGVAVRDRQGLASPMLFAPVPGGIGSETAPGGKLVFSALLCGERGDTTDALQNVAERLFGFTGNRNNALGSLNETIENMISYVLGPYSRFLDKEKGCTYATDVPGAVKNVSSLNPLEIAVLNDNRTMLLERALPVYEYVLSREKLLFCADSTQNIQYPSRRMNGPCCPVSELTALSSILKDNAPYLLSFAGKEYHSTRVRNLDVVEQGGTWRNAMHLYRATGEPGYLKKAVAGADRYIRRRIDTPAADFRDPEAGGFFFWTGFAPKWIDLLEMYELTGDKAYLRAAHRGAKLYTQYVWYSPAVPDRDILVNPDGKAPHYQYLKSKGHAQMDAPAERVPAWRLSEIGLTPESSGTSTGHRGIFMANYAAWMLRLAHYTGDGFLARTADHAVIGRYRNFPGYHINTARTTVYEKADYPLRGHMELGANSFHYNHIMPHISLLYDFLVTQALFRSGGKVDFPGEFIEGYAYLQSKFYGHLPGTIYGREARLWMPTGLAAPADRQLNYISAIDDDALYIVFMNQSAETVETEVALDYALSGHSDGGHYRTQVIGGSGASGQLADGRFTVRVAGNGIAAVRIETPTPIRPQLAALFTAETRWQTPYAATQDDAVRCMRVGFGRAANNVFVYLTQDDTQLRKVWFTVDGRTTEDTDYPFEHTAPIDGERTKVTVKALTRQGRIIEWKTLELKK